MTLPIAMRRTVAIAAVLALSLLLLRSACDVLAFQLPGSEPIALSLVHHDSIQKSHPGDALHVGSHEATVAAIPAPANGPLIFAPLGAVLAFLVLAVVSPIAPQGVAAPPLRSYYARSARILR